MAKWLFFFEFTGGKILLVPFILKNTAENMERIDLIFAKLVW